MADRFTSVVEPGEVDQHIAMVSPEELEAFAGRQEPTPEDLLDPEFLFAAIAYIRQAAASDEEAENAIMLLMDQIPEEEEPE